MANLSDDWKNRITINPQIKNGNPCIRDLRISVNDVLSYLVSGMTVEEILDDFPYLEREDIFACFAFCASVIKFYYHS